MYTLRISNTVPWKILLSRDFLGISLEYSGRSRNILRHLTAPGGSDWTLIRVALPKHWRRYPDAERATH